MRKGSKHSAKTLARMSIGIRRALPDILVEYQDRSMELIEIRPKWRRTDAQSRAKFRAARLWCDHQNIRFRVVGKPATKTG